MDEEAEFNCELVLQDPDLPAQIRVTILEGLSLLAIRHVQQKLGDIAARSFDAYRFSKDLTNILPTVHVFAMRAGQFACDLKVGRFEEAVTYLTNAVYGKASNDTNVSQTDRYLARRLLAFSLINLGRFKEAQREFEYILDLNPADFGAQFHLKLMSSRGQGVDLSILATSIQLYEKLRSHSFSNYSGFHHSDCKAACTPQVLPDVPSSPDFNRFVKQREPFIVKNVDLKNRFQWSTTKWANESYLLKKAGHAKVCYEKTNMIASNIGYKDQEIKSRYSHWAMWGWGYGIDATREIDTFEAFLTGRTEVRRPQTENEHGMASAPEMRYLNVQPRDGDSNNFKQDVWYSPLSHLREDIPLPPMLKEFEDDILMINMWMSSRVRPINTNLVSKIAIRLLSVILSSTP